MRYTLFNLRLAALSAAAFATVVLGGRVIHFPTLAAEPVSGVAVVELFTSEGCSSCPPADAALADLIKGSKGQPIYALAFHVDYWDNLGWADPFDAHAYADRQEGYRRLFKLGSVYTPQAIVNGESEFVGSNRESLSAAVKNALTTPVVGTLHAAVKRAGGKVAVDVTSSGLPAGATLNVALVERGLSSNVLRGENGGRKLTHENVVRDFVQTAIADHGAVTASLTLPAGGKTENISVIAYAQRQADRHVIAATEEALPK